jgi:hypothetical protein
MAAERLFAPPLAHNAKLAIRAFEAEQHFNQALSDFQGANLPLREGTDAALFLQAANQAGFAWTLRAAHGDSVELALLHNGGAEIAITTTAAALLPTLLGLLGVLPTAEPIAQPVEPEAPTTDGAWLATPPGDAPDLLATATDGLLSAAAQSLAAATDGAVAAAGPAADGAVAAAFQPLSEEQKATAVAMVNAIGAAQRKSFSIAFRNAFAVSRDVISLVPLITELRHLQFIDRFTAEATGKVAA